MPHVRAQIRASVKAVLDTLPGYTVFKTRRYSINQSQLPMIDMVFDAEAVEGRTMRQPDGSLVKMRTGRLHIRVTREATEEDIDDLLDDDAAVIEDAIAAADIPGIIGGELVQTDFTDQEASGKTVSKLVLQYDVQYRTALGDASTMKG